jgi:hypothetical protein
MEQLTKDKKQRLSEIIKFSWNILIEYVSNKKVKLNKESSLQLHYSAILKQIGELFCVKPNENFWIELESNYGGKNIDIFCGIDNTKAAIEMKCFKKYSSSGGKSAAHDIKMYDVFVDISRISDYEDGKYVDLGFFLCYTDDSYFVKGGTINGYAENFNTREGRKYKKGQLLKPSWIGKWKNKERDKEIKLRRDIEFNWITRDSNNFLILEI